MPLTQLSPEEYLQNASETPLWQSLAWKEYQLSLRRETRIYGLKTPDGNISASALVIIDHTAFGLSVWDIPRGPIGTSEKAVEELIEGIVEEARREKCMTVYFSPINNVLAYWHTGVLGSDRYEQPEETLIIDLTLSDDEILSQMKQKGRYNIRVAQKNNVTVEESKDIDAFYEILQKTSTRDGFKIKPKSHYGKFLQNIPGSFLLLAYMKRQAASGRRQAAAGLLGLKHNTTGYYYYGASDHEHRALMAPYLLQWEAIQLCKKKGCREYDFLGISSKRLAASDKHPWEGVTRFKMQFGGEVRKYEPEKMIVLKPVVKKLIDWKRKVWK